MDRPRPRRAHSKWRAALGVLGLSVLVALLAGAVRGLERRAPELPLSQLTTGKVTRGDFVVQVHAAGTLRPESVRWVSAESAGRVEKVLALAGNTVAAESVILELENMELRLQTGEAERAVHAALAQSLLIERQGAQEELRLEAELATLRQESTDARSRAEAFAALAGLVIPRRDSEQAQARAAALAEQSAVVSRALGTLRSLGPRQQAVMQQEVAELRRLRDARRALQEQLRVRAGAPGTLQEVLVEPGQWVTPGTKVAKVMVTERLEALLRVPAEHAGSVQIGQRAEVRTGPGRSGEAVVWGQVRRLAPAAQQGTVEVWVSLDETPPGARPEQSIDGRIELEHVPAVLQLPRPAGLPMADTARLYRVDRARGVATQVLVRLGKHSPSAVEVQSGLSESDEIILSDLQRFSPSLTYRLE